jgi:hypothetical protein
MSVKARSAEQEAEGYTPVATGSMRKRLRAEGIEALRGACDGGGKRDLPPPFFISVDSKGS